MGAFFIAFGLAVAAVFALAGICLRQRRIMRRLRRRNSEIWIDWKSGIQIERFQERRITYLTKEVRRLEGSARLSREALDLMVTDLLEGDAREDALATRCQALESEVETLRATVSRAS